MNPLKLAMDPEVKANPGHFVTLCMDQVVTIKTCCKMVLQYDEVKVKHETEGVTSYCRALDSTLLNCHVKFQWIYSSHAL